MKEPRTPDRKKGGRRPVLAKESSNAKLFADDYVTVGKLIKSWGKTESEVIRIIVYDWLRANRARAPRPALAGGGSRGGAGRLRAGRLRAGGAARAGRRG